MSKDNRHRLIIIGCGASGMAAAISASVYEKDILILERNPVPGKKIPATGNGKCNFTNENVSAQDFRSNSGNPFDYYNRFNNRDVIDFFENLGVPVFSKNGYCYPHSAQAASVRDALVNRLEETGIPIIYDCRVTAITKENEGFKLKCGQDYYFCDKLIIAAGGEAQKCFGTDGSFYYILEKLGHSIIKQRPALVGLTSSYESLKDLSGVRHEANVKLLIDNAVSSQEYGEIIFNKGGISGIPVMNASRFAVEALDKGQNVSVALDFFPETNKEKLSCYLAHQFSSRKLPVCRCLTGVLNDKLISVILKDCGVPLEFSDRNVENSSIFEKIADRMKNFILQIMGTAGFDNAQTTSGGIPLYELDKTTLESKKCAGLYVVGELADVDGKCGGYNLQWAWTSGVIAGAYAGGGEFDKSKLIKT